MSSTRDLCLAIDRFQLGELISPATPVDQAWSNDVFHVQTTTGAYAVKLYPRRMSTNRRAQLFAGMAFEQAVLQAGSVPIPQPVAAGEDRLVELDTPSGLRLTRCHHWVSGAPAVRPLRSDLIRAAGRYLSILHAMQRPGGDTSELPPFDSGRWTAALCAARDHRLGWADHLGRLTPLVEGLAADLDLLRQQRRPMLISHRDYDPKNAVVDTAGQLVITDWDYAGPVLPDVELLVAATSFANTDDDVRTFVTAYREVGGDAPGTDQVALAAEAADLDWLLRNVEACSTGADPVATSEQYDTAAALIATFPTSLASLRAWPDRLGALCP